jgi:outer membrane murein-binding lipoprotein Lpp
MFNSIKLMAASVLACSILAGCATKPTPESVQMASYSAGQLAAFVATTTKQFTPEVRAATIVVLTGLNSAVPTNGQTITQAWMPVINTTVDKLVAQGKLNPAFKPAVIAVGAAMTLAVDAELSQHPEWKSTENYIVAVCGGFTLGAKSFLEATSASVMSADPEKTEAMKAIFKSRGL